MIARNVTMHLKHNSVPAVTQALEKQVIPLLRKQKGFADEIAFIVLGGRETVGISIWEKQEDAEGLYPRSVPRSSEGVGERA